MFRIWVKDHKLPIGADSQETVDEIKQVYGEENILLVEEVTA